MRSPRTPQTLTGATSFRSTNSRVVVRSHFGLSPAKNNQKERINWAKDYEFAATLGPLGAVAQLGERRHGMAEATGSSPVGSTLF
jgi:hypothetical protein